MNSLLNVLNSLSRNHIHFSLEHYREDAVMVKVAVPGQRWEIEFLRDGSVEVEVFKSDGDIRDESALRALLDRGGGLWGTSFDEFSRDFPRKK